MNIGQIMNDPIFKLQQALMKEINDEWDYWDRIAESREREYKERCRTKAIQTIREALEYL